MNSQLSRAFVSRVREISKADLATIPLVARKLKEIFSKFDPLDHIQVNSLGNTFLTRPLSAEERVELEILSEYQQSKVVRYGRNYNIDKVVLLDPLISTEQQAIEDMSAASGISMESKIQLWTLNQTRPADYVLLSELRVSLGKDFKYLNRWSLLGGRYIDFAHPDIRSYESGIENALADLL